MIYSFTDLDGNTRESTKEEYEQGIESLNEYVRVHGDQSPLKDGEVMNLTLDTSTGRFVHCEIIQEKP